MEMNVDCPVEDSTLMELFLNELKEIYCAEKALTKAIAVMSEKASSTELKKTLDLHLAETHVQISSLEKVFELLSTKPCSSKCEGMEGLILEGAAAIAFTKAGAMRDAGIISAAQKIEHYEIAAYGILRTFALTMGFTEAASILHEILGQERATDEKLTSLAESTINALAVRQRK